MSEPIRRSLRTLLQLIAAWVTTGGIVAIVKATGNDIDPAQAAAIAVVLTPLVAWAQNALEDNGKLTPILGTKFETGDTK